MRDRFTKKEELADLKNWSLSSEERQRIDKQIDSFLDHVFPSQEVMDAILGVYEHLRNAIESS